MLVSPVYACCVLCVVTKGHMICLYPAWTILKGLLDEQNKYLIYSQALCSGVPKELIEQMRFILFCMYVPYHRIKMT